MYICLTGGTGFIGSHIVVEILNSYKNIKCLILDNLVNSDIKILENIQKLVPENSFVFEYCDLTNFDSLKNILQKYSILAVIHLAGYKSVAESNEFPLLYYNNNIISTLNLLKAMTELNIQNLIFSSSATVYGNLSKSPFNESMPCQAINVYGTTKYWSEQIIKDSKIHSICLRYFNPVACHPSGLLNENPKTQANNLFPYLLDVIAGKKPHLYIFGSDYHTSDGTAIRDYIHVQDLAKAHIKAYEYLIQHKKSFEIINIGTNIGYSVLEILHLAESYLNSKIPHIFTSARTGDVDILVADVQKAHTLLNWKAEYNIKDMIKHAIDSLNPKIKI